VKRRKVGTSIEPESYIVASFIATLPSHEVEHDNSLSINCCFDQGAMVYPVLAMRLALPAGIEGLTTVLGKSP
jgi:hypothetical protein